MSAAKELATYTPQVPRVPGGPEIENLWRIAQYAAGTRLARGTENRQEKPYENFFRMMYGMELGIPPMTALRQIHVVDGGPSLSGEGMLAIINRFPHAQLTLPDPGKIVESVTIGAKRTDKNQSIEVTFSIQEALQANLITAYKVDEGVLTVTSSKKNWQKYPQMMMYWRAVSRLGKLMFSDVIGGMYLVEELNPDIEVDAQGQPAITVEKPEPPAGQSESPPGEQPSTDAPAWVSNAAERKNVFQIGVDRGLGETVGEVWEYIADKLEPGRVLKKGGDITLSREAAEARLHELAFELAQEMTGDDDAEEAETVDESPASEAEAVTETLGEAELLELEFWLVTNVKGVKKRDFDWDAALATGSFRGAQAHLFTQAAGMEGAWLAVDKVRYEKTYLYFSFEDNVSLQHDGNPIQTRGFGGRQQVTTWLGSEEADRQGVRKWEKGDVYPLKAMVKVAIADGKKWYTVMAMKPLPAADEIPL